MITNRISKERLEKLLIHLTNGKISVFKRIYGTTKSCEVPDGKIKIAIEECEATIINNTLLGIFPRRSIFSVAQDEKRPTMGMLEGVKRILSHITNGEYEYAEGRANNLIKDIEDDMFERPKSQKISIIELRKILTAKS